MGPPQRECASPAISARRGGYENTFSVGDMFQNTNMKRVSGTKKSISHEAPGDVLEYYFWPGECKTQASTFR